MLTSELYASRIRQPLFPELPFDLVVIAASAGGIAAIRSVLASLPSDFPVPIAIAQHLAPLPPSLVHHVWSDRGRLPVNFAREGDRLRRGKVFAAPPNRHLLLGPECRWTLTDFEKVNHVRPAADLLFESAAHGLGSRILGAVLTGMGQDGARGACAIKKCGGTVIVQDPISAEAPSMPQATLDQCKVDLVLPLASVPHALIALTAHTGVRDLLGISLARAPVLGRETLPVPGH